MEWRPIGLEAFDHILIHNQELTGVNAAGRAALPRPQSTGAWMLVEFGADRPNESAYRAEDFVRWLKSEQKYDDDRIMLAREGEQFWSIREAGLGVATAVAGAGARALWWAARSRR